MFFVTGPTSHHQFNHTSHSHVSSNSRNAMICPCVRTVNKIPAFPVFTQFEKNLSDAHFYLLHTAQKLIVSLLRIDFFCSLPSACPISHVRAGCSCAYINTNWFYVAINHQPTFPYLNYCLIIIYFCGLEGVGHSFAFFIFEGWLDSKIEPKKLPYQAGAQPTKTQTHFHSRVKNC